MKDLDRTGKKKMAFVEMDLAEKSGCFPPCLSFSRGFSSDTLQASDKFSILPLHLSISFSELPGISAHTNIYIYTVVSGSTFERKTKTPRQPKTTGAN